MRTVLSYILLFTLALSGWSGSVPPAHAYTLADAMATQQHTKAQHSTPMQLSADDSADDNAEMPCHTAATTTETSPSAEHDCCEQTQQCTADCCSKHCAGASALLATELFRYIRPNNIVATLQTKLPQWLFAEDPPPPINA